MIFYLSLFFLFFLFSFYEIFSIKIKNVKDVLFVFCLLLLILLGGLRWKTGTDWQPYYSIFSENNTVKSFMHYFGKYSPEKGYMLLNYIVKHLYNNYTFFLLICSSICIGFTFKFIKRYSSFPLFSIFLFYCFFLGFMFFTRQAIAISILLYSIKYIEERKFWRFLIIVILTTTIHSSVFLFIPAYWIYNLNYSNKKIVVILSIAIIIGAFDLILLPLKYLASLLGNDSKVGYRLNIYMIDNDILNRNVNPILAKALSFSKRLIIIPFLLYFRHSIERKDKTFLGMLNLYLFGNILFFIFHPINAVSVRGTAIFSLIEIVLFPSLLFQSKSLANKFLFMILIVFYGLVKLFWALNSYWDLYVPYYWIFSHNIIRTLS